MIVEFAIKVVNNDCLNIKDTEGILLYSAIGTIEREFIVQLTT